MDGMAHAADSARPDPLKLGGGVPRRDLRACIAEHLVERRAVENFAAHHHRIDRPRRSDILERVFRQQHQIGRHSRLDRAITRSEEHTSELQSLMRTSYAVFCLKKKKTTTTQYIK